jgi:hypothetical protein
MLIQILQSKGQLLTSGARPGMDRYHRLYIFLVSHRLGLITSLALPTAFVNTPDIVKFCGLAPVGFTSLCWRGVSTLKSCVPRCVFFLIFVICLSLL